MERKIQQELHLLHGSNSGAKIVLIGFGLRGALLASSFQEQLLLDTAVIVDLDADDKPWIGHISRKKTPILVDTVIRSNNRIEEAAAFLEGYFQVDPGWVKSAVLFDLRSESAREDKVQIASVFDRQDVARVLGEE
jgi:hypothetical protein